MTSLIKVNVGMDSIITKIKTSYKKYLVPVLIEASMKAFSSMKASMKTFSSKIETLNRAWITIILPR